MQAEGLWRLPAEQGILGAQGCLGVCLPGVVRKCVRAVSTVGCRRPRLRGVLVDQGGMGVFCVVTVFRPVPLSARAHLMVDAMACEDQMQRTRNLYQDEAHACRKRQQRCAPFKAAADFSLLVTMGAHGVH
ncbi:MAG: hypothetical protein OSB57_08680 [Planctomycetota bacterium]|nr:hypothetical protein [Planctomycetota bacterium]